MMLRMRSDLMHGGVFGGGWTLIIMLMKLHGFTSSLYKTYIQHTKPLTASFLSSGTNTIFDIVVNSSRAC